MALFRENGKKKKLKWKIKTLRIPSGWRQTSWLFTSVAEDLNSGCYQEQIQLAVKARLGTQRFRITSPAL